MEEVLKRVGALAYLEYDDVSRLEADIRDMILMAESLSEFQADNEDCAFGVPLCALREDQVKNAGESKAVDFARDLRVPRISGV